MAGQTTLEPTIAQEAANRTHISVRSGVFGLRSRHSEVRCKAFLIKLCFLD